MLAAAGKGRAVGESLGGDASWLGSAGGAWVGWRMGMKEKNRFSNRIARGGAEQRVRWDFSQPTVEGVAAAW